MYFAILHIIAAIIFSPDSFIFDVPFAPPFLVPDPSNRSVSRPQVSAQPPCRRQPTSEPSVESELNQSRVRRPHAEPPLLPSLSEHLQVALASPSLGWHCAESPPRDARASAAREPRGADPRSGTPPGVSVRASLRRQAVTRRAVMRPAPRTPSVPAPRSARHRA